MSHLPYTNWSLIDALNRSITPEVDHPTEAAVLARHVTEGPQPDLLSHDKDLASHIPASADDAGGAVGGTAPKSPFATMFQAAAAMRAESAASDGDGATTAAAAAAALEQSELQRGATGATGSGRAGAGSGGKLRKALGALAVQERKMGVLDARGMPAYLQRGPRPVIPPLTGNSAHRVAPIRRPE